MIALVPMVTVASLCVSAVLGFIRPGGEVSSLRQGLEKNTPGGITPKVCVSVGGGACALTRLGMSFTPLPPEAKAAISAARGADVGVFEMSQPCARKDLRKVLVDADNRMRARGWDRVVGVMENTQLVAVYCPRKGMDLSHVRVCVLVLDNKDAVLVSARANLTPLQPMVCEALKKNRDQWPGTLIPPAML